MRLPDPFTNPEYDGLGFDSVSLTDNDPVIRDELPNGKVSEVRTSAQYWSIDISYPDLFPDEYALLSAFLLDYKRLRTTIEVILPQYENYRVTGSTAGVTIPSGQKGNSLVLESVSGLSGTPKAGDLFKLSTHSKVYKITSVDTSVTGQWTLGIYPDLFITTSGTEKPVFNAILFTCKLINGDSFKESITNDGVYTGVSLQIREHIE